MNKNEENFKSAFDQIHAPEDLKEKTFEKMKNQKSSKSNMIKFMSCAAVFLIVFSAGFLYINNNKIQDPTVDPVPGKTPSGNLATADKIELPRFKDMDQLKEVLKKSGYGYGSMYNDMLVTDSMAMMESADTSGATFSKGEEQNATISRTDKDYSKTNTQVENVDEADIVKTDGEYIYYTNGMNLFIVRADDLELMATIKFSQNDDEYHYAYTNINELFINDNKLIVFVNSTKHKVYNYGHDNNDYERPENFTKAFVYNLDNIKKPEIEREVAIEGNYSTSRMIGDNVYFISTNYVYCYDNMEDEDYLPIYKDTNLEDESKVINCTDIIYFPDSHYNNYTFIAGFNLNNDEEVSVETFYGASNTIYASENNLYIAQADYAYDRMVHSRVEIYKFQLNESKIYAVAKTRITGELYNQFSMDEYEGNLRVAVTVDKTTFSSGRKETNRVYVLDENLEEIGRVDDFAKDESIYAVRFIGKVGYVVTFEQVDPLFVLDLSDPTNPQIKGELEIPGYSSYLHPYDETHIIGIGHNVKSNGYGGVTNDNMKMTMFDVSDLENPKELFSVDIGDKYTHSDILNNHKALFYKESENLIGFPISTYRNRLGGGYVSGIIIYKINMKNEEFEEYGEIFDKDYYSNSVQRLIYIEDTIYTLAPARITSYDIKELKQKDYLELDYREYYTNYTKDYIIDDMFLVE